MSRIKNQINYENSKTLLVVAIALITMISFSSCESDEERGFDISGLYGKTWWGDMGFEDRYGEPLYSYITFTSGAFTDHGVGTEERCYHNDELYRVYKFDWEIQNGWLYYIIQMVIHL